MLLLLLYSSSAMDSASPEELEEIHSQSKANNRVSGVTGVRGSAKR